MAADWRARFRAPSITLPHWARDEPARAVYVSNASGTFEGYAWDIKAGTHRQVTSRPEGTIGVTISPGGDAIWWWDDTKGNELGAWRVEGFEAEGEAHYAAPALEPGYTTGLSIGREFAVVGTAGGGTHRVDVIRDGAAPERIYEHKEAANLGSLSRDETLVVVAHAEHGDSRNRALRVLTIEGATRGELWDGPNQGFTPMGWSRVAGDQRLLVGHERTGIQRPAIWDLESGDLTDVDVDLPGEISASWYPDSEALLLTHFWRGRHELFKYDVATSATERVPTEPGVVLGAAIRPDGELWYSLSRSSTPTEVHCGSEILRPPGERAPGGVSYRDVEAGEVHGFVATPQGDGPHPTIFRIHGGPSGVDADMFAAGVQAWVDHGFAVVMVNYRGSSGYGKEWRDAIVGKPGVKEIADIAAIREVVIADGTADSERIVLSGGSWGGYLTLLGIGAQPDLWTLGLAGVPLADLAAHYPDQSEPLKAYWRSLFGGTPDEIADVLKEISPIEHVAKVRAPVLILAGDNDPRCPLPQVLNYVKRLEELGKDHELYRYDAGHGSYVVDEQIRQIEKQIQYCAEHLGTPAPIS